jgi:hypothetical protein
MNKKTSQYLLTANDFEVELTDEFSEYSVVFVSGLNERDIDEMYSRGYRSHVYITDKINNLFWPLIFYEPVRLVQELKPEGYIADTGLVVVREITKTILIETCINLLRDKYIKYHKSYTLNELKDLFNFDLFHTDTLVQNS